MITEFIIIIINNIIIIIFIMVTKICINIWPIYIPLS